MDKKGSRARATGVTSKGRKRPQTSGHASEGDAEEKRRPTKLQCSPTVQPKQWLRNVQIEAGSPTYLTDIDKMLYIFGLTFANLAKDRFYTLLHPSHAQKLFEMIDSAFISLKQVLCNAAMVALQVSVLSKEPQLHLLDEYIDNEVNVTICNLVHNLREKSFFARGSAERAELIPTMTRSLKGFVQALSSFGDAVQSRIENIPIKVPEDAMRLGDLPTMLDTALQTQSPLYGVGVSLSRLVETERAWTLLSEQLYAKATQLDAVVASLAAIIKTPQQLEQQPPEQQQPQVVEQGGH